MPHRISDVAKAIDPSDSVALTKLIRGWLTQGLLPLATETTAGVDSDEPSSRPGSAILVSRHTAIRIAFTVALVRLGLPPGDAAAAAAGFSHVSAPPRIPGELFATGDTSLCVWRDLDGTLRQSMANHGPADGLGYLRSLIGRGKPVTAPLIVVDCAAVLRSLDGLLKPDATA